MKNQPIKKFPILNFILIIIILFVNFLYSTASQNNIILYIKTNGYINGFEIINKLNKSIISQDLNIIEDENCLVKKEIELNYEMQILNINISINITDEIYLGILLERDNIFYDLNEENSNALFNQELEFINFGEIYIKNSNRKILYYSPLNINETEIIISIPNCYFTCSDCNIKGNSQNHSCIKCNNENGYYFKEGDNNNCFNKNNTINGYYFDEIENRFKKCNKRCSSCKGAGIDSSSNCIKCKNEENYHFSPIKQNHCIKIEELETPNYYIDIIDDKIKLCEKSCLTCKGPNNNNCTSCNGVTFFETQNFENRCLNLSEIPLNYYRIVSHGKAKYYKCHESCKTCSVGGNYKCDTCNIEKGYYPIEGKEGYCLLEKDIPNTYYLDLNQKKIFKCEINCNSCSKGYDNITNQMNCDTCISGTYFENISSTNCIPKPETNYYIGLYNGQKTLFPCHKNCLTCNKGGDDYNNECLTCAGDLYFDDENITNCVDDDLECALGCAKCYKNKTNSEHGILSADKMCKRCSFKMGYFPLEKFSQDQFYVSCYPFNNPPRYYIFDEIEKVHKLCYKTCANCYEIGDDLNHSCINCDINYKFIDEEPSNCFPQCKYYYFYTKYNQYKCTENEECPFDYPYLIENKTKCVDNCYHDDQFNLMFKNECIEKCPEGTSALLYIYNGEITAKCADSNETLDENECKLNIINNNNFEYDKINEEILDQYAQDYIHEYPISNTYVTTYSSSTDSINKYLIVIYKLEKCPKQKVEGFISIGLEECVDKIRTKYGIIKNIVIQIFLIIRKNASPQISYFLYHPDTGEKLDLSICSGTKLAIKTSIFDNSKVNENLVKYFADLKINLFDIKDPFFTDICFIYAKDGKDVPLEDRVKLYYQNVSLCEEGCAYMGINLDSFEVECSCELQDQSNKNNNEAIAKSILDNPISNEVFGVITNSNLEVLKCITKAFNRKLFFKNYGGLMMIGIFFSQIIITVFIKFQIKQVRNFIYSLIMKLKFPPKRKINLVFRRGTIISNSNELANKQSKDIIVYNSSCNAINEKNKQNQNNKTIKNKNDIKYQLIKQNSLISISSFNGQGNKDKYPYVKQGSIPYSTQQTNYTGKGKNYHNYSNKDNNIILNANNSSGSANSFNSGENGIPINSGSSDLSLKIIGEMEELPNDENEIEKIHNNEDINQQNGMNNNINEINGLGYFNINEFYKNNSHLSYNSYFDEKENIYNIENENNFIPEGSKEIENGNIVQNNNTINNKNNLDKGKNEIVIFKKGKKKSNLKHSKKAVRKSSQKLNSSKKIENAPKVVFLDLGNKTESNSKLQKDEEIMKNLKIQLRKQILTEIRERHREKRKTRLIRKQTMVPYDHKEYNSKEINQLDYEEAIIYDKRNYCQIFWCTLKEKQTLINTFFVKDPLKPFSIKLLVIIFSFSCYFVINGFLYNEEYVSKKLKNTGSKTFYEYLSDSIERILFTSIVGGIISFIIGILFNTEKKIDKEIEKNKKNKILLKGEIAKIYRCNNIRLICFIIIQFILMILFIIYIFCFCYVYSNNKLDWFESSLLVIGIMQMLSLFNSFVFSIIKYLSIKCQWELCFKINAYLDDNL